MKVDFETKFNNAHAVRRYLRDKIPAIASFSVRSELATFGPLETARIEDVQQIFIVCVLDKDRAAARQLLEGTNAFLSARKRTKRLQCS